MSDLINQSMNDKAVYRTAPATPGLLNIYILTSSICKNHSFATPHFISP